MQDLQEVTHEIHYENYRFEKLQLQKYLDQDEKQKKLIQEKDNEVNTFTHTRARLHCILFSFVECKKCSLKCRLNYLKRSTCKYFHSYL